MKEYYLYDINGATYRIKAEKIEIWNDDTIVFLMQCEMVAMAFLHNIVIVVERQENDKVTNGQ